MVAEPLEEARCGLRCRNLRRACSPAGRVGGSEADAESRERAAELGEVATVWRLEAEAGADVGPAVASRAAALSRTVRDSTWSESSPLAISSQWGPRG